MDAFIVCVVPSRLSYKSRVLLKSEDKYPISKGKGERGFGELNGKINYVCLNRDE